jgi:flagellar biosynthesis protein FlhG
MLNDQATTLRRMAASPAPGFRMCAREQPRGAERLAPGVARSVAITGGKGGVGKTNVAVNLALALAERGRRVSLLDADLGLANADVLLGLSPEYHLGHVLAGQRTLEEVVVETGWGVRLLPGGSGIEELANLTRAEHRRLASELRAMEDASDYLVVDTAAGVAGNVTGVLEAASEVVVVTTPEPTSVVDAYALIKILHRYAPGKRIRVVVNHAVGVGDAEHTFAQLNSAARRFLGRAVEHLGTIPRDPSLAEAVRERIPVLAYAPDTPASRALRLIAKFLDAGGSSSPGESFWEQLFETRD